MAKCQPQIVTQKVTSSWVIYRALVGIGMLCSLLIVSVYLFTQPLIAANRQAAVEQAIYAVLPSATTYQEWVYETASEPQFRSLSITDENKNIEGLKRFYAGYDSQQKLVGIAMLAQGRGYQDRILIMYGYSPEQQAIIGMQVLESRETPGLGDRIETDANFKQNFIRLDVSVNDDATALNNPIRVTRYGQKSPPWQIDGITGATVSSLAIGNMLADSTEKWVPLIYRNRDAFQKGSHHE